MDGEFLWDEYSQGIILGSFFYGYVLTQIPGGRLAETFGGKLVFGLGGLFEIISLVLQAQWFIIPTVFVTAIFTLLTPLAAKTSLPALVLVRVLEGIGEGEVSLRVYSEKLNISN